MPALKNARHERFSQELAKGKTADEAYQLAGYAENRGNATRLKANESVLRRVDELKERAAEKAEWTAADRLKMLEEIATAAKEGDPRVSVSAIAEANKMQGSHAPVKSEVGRPGDFDRMTDDELADYVAAETAALGASHAGASEADDQAGVRKQSRGLH